ncbi:uncharacterized protein LOC112539518 [Tetranychus urticae]|uniref:Uncharacterized protein n=1 Tax=Tetranychus urticae TaxID=32264 RepID=T1KXP3_TETUR|nr:uncharacterized protein LOC112539518 [Tetranychus urticae]
MNQSDHDFDKTTIRVELSDAHHDIIIDWSKEFDDVVKEMFRQLAEFTGMPIEKTWAVRFMKPPGNDVHPENPFVHFAGSNSCLVIGNSPEFNIQYTKEDIRYKFFGDDNCFALNTMLDTTFFENDLTAEYLLFHRDLIDETECNTMFCHHSSNRAFLDKQAKIMNFNFESYLRDRPLPNLSIDNFDVILARKWKILVDLNIGQYFDSYCKVYVSNETFDRRRLRTYWPNRG